jgi:hypothetical protein
VKARLAAFGAGLAIVLLAVWLYGERVRREVERDTRIAAARAADSAWADSLGRLDAHRQRLAADSARVARALDSTARAASIARDIALRFRDSVRLAGPTTVIIRDTAHEVPPEVVQRIQADSAALEASGATVVALGVVVASERALRLTAEQERDVWRERHGVAVGMARDLERAAYARGLRSGRIQGVGAVLGVAAVGAVVVLRRDAVADPSRVAVVRIGLGR